MPKIVLNEPDISKAIQRYLQDKGYIVQALLIVHNGKNNDFFIMATVEEE